MDTLSENNMINEAERQWDSCVTALDAYQRWVDNHTYEIQIMETIDQLIRENGGWDLEDNEFSEFVSKKFKGFQDHKDDLIEEVDRSVSSFVNILEGNKFLEQFNSSSLNPLNRLQRKYKYLHILIQSEAGINHLEYCAKYAPASSIEPPIYCFSELEKDLGLVEQTHELDANRFTNYSVLFLKLFGDLIPEFTKIKDLENRRVYYFAYLVSSRYRDAIITNSSSERIDYDTFELGFFEQSVLDLLIELGNIPRNTTGKIQLVISSLKWFLQGIKLGFKINQLNTENGAIGSIELLSSIISMAEEISKLKFNRSAEKILNTSLTTSSKALNLAFITNRYGLQPIIFCYQINKFANAAAINDRRESLIALTSAASAISLTVIGLLGLASPVGIAVTIGLILTSIAISYFVDSSREKNIKSWLNNNYFGIKSLKDKDKDYLLNFDDPVNIGFEWDRTSEGGRLVKEIRSIFSLLRPLNSNSSKDSSDVGNNIYVITFELENPTIPPKDFYLRIRFFNIEGQEVTNTDLDEYAGEKGESWYLIPVSIKDSKTITKAWKQNPNNKWYKNQTIELLHPDEPTSEKNRITLYKVEILVKAALPFHTHYYYQIQIISAPQDFTEDNYNDQYQLEKVLESNPFIISETGLLDTSIF